ncbi:hypothetical protein [Tsukamurella paurometabola]|uniref:Glycosyltransferase n=1 Tax=Tsukamurella paurometabola TaxID=2061 RepID=A0ABS5NDR4_TSUPA|nr:hypothetical protein [Tsukamurella paurometabola]MBS4102407.1 hypothetical protein [Tsukamurella paurometabola]
MNVVLFCFAGRQPNMEMQLQWVEQVLRENDNVEYHVWDLTRNNPDHVFVQSISGDRVTVKDDFRGGNPCSAWDDVWKWYAARPEYRDTLFVKVDDDVVYFDASRWTDFVQAVDANRGQVVSALTVNNGASTPLIPGIEAWLTERNFPLLDVHESNEYADHAHKWFFEHHAELTDRPVEVKSTDDWVSINFIGMSWHVLCCVAQMVKTPSPAHIAGRDWRPGTKLGDEGACNMLPRLIVDGVVAGHLTFGPQKVTAVQADRWRKGYRGLVAA